MKKYLLLIAFLAFGYWGFGQSATTNDTSHVKQLSATLNGTAAAATNPGSDVYYHWKKVGTLTDGNIQVAVDISTSSTSYPYNMTGLDANQQYEFYIFVYDGSNIVATGSTLTFTTLALAAPTVTTGSSANVSYTSFDVTGNDVTDDGGDAITEEGLVYSTTNNPPTTADTKATYTPNGTGSYDVSLSSLSSGTTYYVRAYAINGQGTSYGSTVTQATTTTTAPTVTIPTGATDITSITKTSAANSGNNATNDGGASITDKGIVWNTSGTPTLSDNAYSSGATGTGTFNGSLTGLSAGTKYYVRAYASNSVGDGYSAEVNFITDTDDPSVLAASNIKSDEFDADWSSTTGAQGYYLDVSTDVGFGAGTFVTGYDNLDVGNVGHKVVSSLSANTDYYYRIRAYHDGGVNGADFTSGNSGTTSVTTLVTAPSTQVSNMKWETIDDGKTMSFNWSDGNGAGNMLIMKASSAVSDPNGGTTYTGNATFGSGSNINGTGTYVVYNATHSKGTSSVDVTNLSSGTTYYFKGVEYDGSGGSTNYNTNSSTGYNSGNSGSTALPIKLISFDASKENSSVILNWETASELNNDQFIIERSIDAVNFESIGKVQGSGTTNTPISYSFSDANNPASIVYYRLKQVDYDGTTTTHSMVSIDMSNNNEGTLLKKALVLNTKLSLELNLEATSATKISLLDINGKLIQGAMSTTPGAQTITFDMIGLSHGIYLIRIQQNDKLVSRKIAY